MPFFLLLLIVFLIWILVPVIRVALFAHQARKQFRSAFDAMKDKGQAGGANSNQGESQNREKRHRKKIDPNVGEYVDFQEIDTPQSSESADTDVADSSPANFTPDEQISDAKWVDLP